MQKPFSLAKVYFLVQTFDLSDFEYKSFDRIPSHEGHNTTLIFATVTSLGKGAV